MYNFIYLTFWGLVRPFYNDCHIWTAKISLVSEHVGRTVSQGTAREKDPRVDLGFQPWAASEDPIVGAPYIPSKQPMFTLKAP